MGAAILLLFSYYAWVALFCVHTHILPVGIKQHAHPYASAGHEHTAIEFAYIDAVMLFQCESGEEQIHELIIPCVIIALNNAEEVSVSLNIILSTQLRAPPTSANLAA